MSEILVMVTPCNAFIINEQNHQECCFNQAWKHLWRTILRKFTVLTTCDPIYKRFHKIDYFFEYPFTS